MDVFDESGSTWAGWPVGRSLRRRETRVIWRQGLRRDGEKRKEVSEGESGGEGFTRVEGRNKILIMLPRKTFDDSSSPFVSVACDKLINFALHH